MRVHRLVAIKFIPNPDGLSSVNHLDEEKANNHLDNLEWISRGDNNRYGTAIARRSKLVLQLTTSGEVIKEWTSTAEAQRKGYKSGGISNCCLGKSHTHAGCRWCYADEYNDDWVTIKEAA